MSTRFPFTQRQDSLLDQLRTVAQLAVEVGCYDAHDVLKPMIDKLEQHEDESTDPLFTFT